MNLLWGSLPFTQLILTLGLACCLSSVITVVHFFGHHPEWTKWIAIINITFFAYFNLYAAQGNGAFRALYIFFEALILVALYLDKSLTLQYSLALGAVNVTLYFLAFDHIYKIVDPNSFFQFNLAFLGASFLLYFITLWGEEMLKRSEERWQFALEGNGDGVWDWNPQTKTIFFSRQWKETLGYAEHELENSWHEWETRIHPEDTAMVWGKIQKHLDGLTPYFSAEYRIRRKDGTYIWVLDRGKIMTRDKDGHPTRMIGSSANVTDRKRAESRVQTLQAQLIQKEKFASLAHLTAGVVHEINSPLGVIKSNIGLSTMLYNLFEELLASPVTEERAFKLQSLIEKLHKANRMSILASDRLVEIIKTLERLSRLDDINWQTVDLHEAIESVLIPLLDEHHEEVTIHRRYGVLPKITCIPGQISQVVMNLILNRIHAADRPCEVTVVTESLHEIVQIIIRDNGTGVTEAQRSRIFDPSLTTKGNVIGMELGLAIAYNIIQSHGGEIFFESDAADGTRFIIQLPVTPPQRTA